MRKNLFKLEVVVAAYTSYWTIMLYIPSFLDTTNLVFVLMTLLALPFQTFPPLVYHKCLYLSLIIFFLVLLFICSFNTMIFFFFFISWQPWTGWRRSKDSFPWPFGVGEQLKKALETIQNPSLWRTMAAVIMVSDAVYWKLEGRMDLMGERAQVSASEVTGVSNCSKSKDGLLAGESQNWRAF